MDETWSDYVKSVQKSNGVVIFVIFHSLPVPLGGPYFCPNLPNEHLGGVQKLFLNPHQTKQDASYSKVRFLRFSQVHFEPLLRQQNVPISEKSQIRGFLSRILTTKNANFCTKISKYPKECLRNMIETPNTLQTQPEKNAP